jgi:TM2 domain-containing membrane protein YozV
MAELSNCPQCGAPISAGAKSCKYCSAVFTQPKEVVQPSAPLQPHIVYVQQAPPAPPVKRIPKKNKMAAGLLAIFLGGIGIHKFYLGQWVQGIIYVLFCWTYVPMLVGFIEGIVYLATSDDKFAAKHGGYC